MYTYFDNRLEERFKIKVYKRIPTDGMRKGIILKFKTFYLKIYFLDYDLYHFQAFLYKERSDKLGPEFEFKVNSLLVQEAIDNFTEDNFLFGVKYKFLRNPKFNIF